MRVLIASVAALGVLLTFSGLTGSSVKRRPRSLLDPLNRLAVGAGYTRLRGAGLLGLCGAGAVCGSVVGAAVSPLIALMLASAAIGASAPLLRARARRETRRDALRHAWPDALADVVSGVRAGLSLAECCTALARRGPLDLRKGFDALSSTYSASGSFDAALTRLQEALEDPVADRVVAVLRLANEVGGNDLVRVLRTSAELIREDLRVRGEIRARWSWTITAARLAAGAPLGVLLIMGMRPEAATAYASGSGTATILVGSVASLIGYRLMLRAARLPEERRIR